MGTFSRLFAKFKFVNATLVNDGCMLNVRYLAWVISGYKLDDARLTYKRYFVRPI